jgi:hypothetical protein
MRVQASILIERPIEAIFTCVTSVAFLQQWVAPFRVEKYDIPPESHYCEVYHTVRYPELRQVAEGALGVGTTFKQSNESRYHLSDVRLAFISLRNPWEEPGIESSHKSGQERLPERKLIRWQQ